MEPPDPSFADEFNVPHEDAVLVFDVRRAAVLLPFQVNHLKVFVEAGLVTSRLRVSSLRTKSQNKLSTAALRTFRRFFTSIFTAFQRLLLWSSARRCLLASSLCGHGAFISASTPGPAHQPCATRGRLERGTNTAAVESMTSAMSVAMSLMQVRSGIGGSASTIAFATWNRRFGSVVNRLRSASFGVSMVLSSFLRFGAALFLPRTTASATLCKYFCIKFNSFYLDSYNNNMHLGTVVDPC